MTGMQEQGRRLRGREVPPPPMTRSAAATMNNLTAGQAENCRRTKAPAKRAAIDENIRLAASIAPVQQAKKRAALSNLTNSNAPTVSHGATASKVVAQASAATKGKARTAKEASSSIPENLKVKPEVDVLVNTENVDQENIKVKREPDVLVHFQRKYTGISEDFKVKQKPDVLAPLQSLENVIPENIKVKQEPDYLVSIKTDDDEVLENNEFTQEQDVLVSEAVERAFQNENEAIASLERKTQNTLYISKDAKNQAIQESNVDAQGWSSKTYIDIDSDHKDPQMCSSYATDIYHHLRMAELKRRPKQDFMDVVQQDINASMRGILIDWLVEVAEEYKLVPDTLYLTVSYIDRFLSGNVVNRQRLQLLGVSCMLIAAKYEEICAPQVEEFCYITDNTYCREEVLDMERRVLKHLHFELAGPTTKSFLRRFVRAAQATMKTPTLQLEFLGNYLAELTLVEYALLDYLPSITASSAVFVAKVTLDPKTRPWNTTMQHYTGYKASELKDCVMTIHDLQRNTRSCTLPAIREKYRQHKFKCVASLAPPAVIPPEYFEDVDV